MHEDETDGDGLAGTEGASGDDAATEARRIERDARRGAPDPLEGLPVRIETAKAPELAFDPVVVREACALEASDGVAFQRFRLRLRAAGVSLGQWDKAVRAETSRQREEAKAQERRATIEALQARALAEAQAVETERQADAATVRDAVLCDHYGEVTVDDTRYRSRPGRVWCERVGRDGIERATLAHFSAVIAETVHAIDTPGAPERVTYVLSVVIGDETFARTVRVKAEDFDRMRWPGAIDAGAAVGAERGARERLCETIRLLSRGVTKRVHACGFLGWHFHRDRWVYLHAGGAIDAAGVTDGIRVAVEDPASRYQLPAPPVGEALRDAARATVQLFDVEPATVMVPAFALAFRSVLGPSRATVHITGRKGLGKSLLMGLVSTLFGPDTVASTLTDGFAASWIADSAIGLAYKLVTIGDACVPTDDLQPAVHDRDGGSLKRFDDTTRNHFNRTSPMKGKPEGGVRTSPISRGSILSTGEVLPRSHSGSSRVLSVMLTERPAPSVDAFERAAALAAKGDRESLKEAATVSSLAALAELATGGVFAAAMAGFVRWYAPYVAAMRPKLERSGRDLARQWDLGDSDRAEALLGALALGIDTWLLWLFDVGALDAAAAEARRERAKVALRQVALDHGEHIEAEDPARLCGEYLGDALRGHDCHAVLMLPGYKRGIPKDCESWGWKRGRDGSPEPCGKPVVYIPIGKNELYVDPGAAVEIAQERARRAGRSLVLDKNTLARALLAARLLARDSLHLDGRKGPNVRVRLSSREEHWWPAVKFEALGFSFADLPEDEDAPPAEPAPPGEFPEVDPQEPEPELEY